MIIIQKAAKGSLTHIPLTVWLDNVAVALIPDGKAYQFSATDAKQFRVTQGIFVRSKTYSVDPKKPDRQIQVTANPKLMYLLYIFAAIIALTLLVPSPLKNISTNIIAVVELICLFIINFILSFRNGLIIK